MNYQSLDEIYAGNDKIRMRLKQLLESIPTAHLDTLPDDEKWTIAQIVEHIAIVDESTTKICTKLLTKAQQAGKTSDGAVTITENFLQKGKEIAGMKVEAPEFVRPTGSKTIQESLAKLDETSDRVEKLKELFASVDGTELKFPHPFFGPISAQEWLALKGGHEMRHIKQIENVLAKIK